MNATFLKASTVTWEECLSSLKRMFPSAKSFALTEISAAMEQKGCTPDWKSMPEWEDLDDIKILREAVGRDIAARSNRAMLIPDLCFCGKHLPFLVNGDFLERFVEAFLVQYGEAFFNGDTVLLFPETKTIYLFHHEGVYARCKCDSLSQ